MLKLRTLLACLSLLSTAVLLHAQGATELTGQKGTINGSGNSSTNATGRLETKIAGGGVAIAGLHAFTTGRPFSADSVTETTDLSPADENHIPSEQHGRIFRDSKGRTRIETDNKFGFGVTPGFQIEIFDPVNGRSILLDSQHKVAIISHSVKGGPQPESGLAAKSASPLGAAVLPATNAGFTAVRTSTEDLGTMIIEGFTVSGRRWSHTVPAGMVGTDKPGVTSNEFWYSPDLQMVLLSTSYNPELSNYRHMLVHIQTTDPDPSLFKVPADFIVKETPQR